MEPDWKRLAAEKRLDHTKAFENILLRLPVKRLGQFKCVSKNFLHKITDTTFNALLTQRDEPISVFVKYNDFPSRGAVIQTKENGYTVEEFDIGHIQYNFNVILGSSGEVVCLGDDAGEHLLFINPCTMWRKVIEAPTTALEEKFGFGYDILSGEFKVVRLTERASASEELVSVRIHSLTDDDDDEWRVINFDDWIFTLGDSSGIFVDDTYYWRGLLLRSPDGEPEEPEEAQNVLVTFDIRTERLGRIAAAGELSGPFASLGLVQNKVCICVCAQDTSLWFLEDGRFERSMTLMFNPNPTCSLQPLFQRGDNLFLLQEKRKITTYNISKASKVNILGFDKTDVIPQGLNFNLVMQSAPKMEAIGFVETLSPTEGNAA